jgi:hypothetical protein
MKTHNAANERIKRAYFAYLREARRNSEQTIDAAASALHQFEMYTRFRDFRSFRIEQAIGFKNHLAKQLSGKTKEPLSKATLFRALAALRAFFVWLAGQPGFRSRISYSDADYFNLSAKDTAVAKADHTRGRHRSSVSTGGTVVLKSMFGLSQSAKHTRPISQCGRTLPSCQCC